MHEKPPREKTYFSYVKAQAQRNPSLSHLVDFLSDNPGEKPCRIVALAFYEGLSVPDRQDLQVENIQAWLRAESHGAVEGGPGGKNKLIGLLLVVEDLNRCIIAELGSYLDIDPLFFASHLHGPSIETGAQLPDTATLPSRAKPQTFTNIHYHRTIVFHQDCVPAGTIFRDTNIPRKVAVLPRIKNQRIGLAQHCTSIYKAKRTDKTWIGMISPHARAECSPTNEKQGVILVDPPTTERFFVENNKSSAVGHLTLSSELFMKGYEDFLDTPSFHDQTHGSKGPQRSALMEDLTYYWSVQTPPGFDVHDPYLLALAYYPLNIVAGEWVKYVAVMSSCIKEYEYSKREKADFLRELEKLDTDLRALQSWRRRTMSTRQKLRAVLRLLKSYQSTTVPPETLASLTEDYEHIEYNVTDCGARLESMLPTVTSLVQIVDSRRSFAETANISRLTVLALVFVPLNFISSLFSMNEKLAPGGQFFWVYFVVAIPVTIFVAFIARPPLRALRRFVAMVRQKQAVAAETLKAFV